MPKLVQDIKTKGGTRLGRILLRDDGKLEYRDLSGWMCGYYDPKTNLTRDYRGSWVGYGNLLATFVKINEAKDSAATKSLTHWRVEDVDNGTIQYFPVSISQAKMNEKLKDGHRYKFSKVRRAKTSESVDNLLQPHVDKTIGLYHVVLASRGKEIVSFEVEGDMQLTMQHIAATMEKFKDTPELVASISFKRPDSLIRYPAPVFQ